MNTIKEVLLTGITVALVGFSLPAQASELMVQANVEPEMSWQVQGRGGLNVGTFARSTAVTAIDSRPMAAPCSDSMSSTTTMDS